MHAFPAAAHRIALFPDALSPAVPPPALQSCGSTCVLVAVQTTLVGVIAVMDPIKPEAR